ncbi:MAG: SCO1664 family protein [Acidimicrobiales bacterium]
MDRAEQLRLLSQGEIDVRGRIVDSSNQALLVAVRLEGAEALACYKAEAGERPLWDFPGGLWRREVAAYELDQLLGVGLVPPTVARDDAPFGPGSLQWWIDGATDDHYFTLRDRDDFDPVARALVVLDVVANNADRKAGHVLFDGVRYWAIDHGLCFHRDDKLRTVLWEFAGEPVAPDLLGRVARVADGDTGALARWLSPEELALTQWRAGELVDAGVYPSPDEDGPWPPYPWPLI